MDIGTVRLVDIDGEMRGAYLDYAMSVITARAIPDVRDGLKPVQRRILYAMDDMGLQPDRPYRKSARIVGEVLGKYHPHGDSAVYDAMVRLAQDFSMRYPLVDGQGNFGSVDGDAAAAMRYTEARLARIAVEMLADIEKETVDFLDNFDGSLKEPKILPTKLPNLILNGASGIAVGMATNIPPHNLHEICDALIYVINRYDTIDDITVDDLMQFVKGPDFPTGGQILGLEGIRNAYAHGQGRVIMRAKAHVEEMQGNRNRIVVTEIPYMVNKATLIERIAELVRDKRLEDISDLRDESDRNGMSVVIELKRGAQPLKVLNRLLKFTQLQGTFGVNMLTLVEGEPRVLSLKKILQYHILHRQEVITRRSQYELAKARARAHILEGLLIALDNLDEVISTIRNAPDTEVARQRLMSKFKLTEIQATAILDMMLRRLAALERKKIKDEYREILKNIAYLEDLLAHPHKILGVIKDELKVLKEKYGDERRTRIMPEEDREFSDEDLIPEENVFISITNRGYIKRVPANTYRPQGRGGKGLIGVVTKEQDAVQHLFLANTHNDLLFFTNKGRAFQLKAHQVPDASRTAAGLPLTNLIMLERNETVTATVAVPSFSDAEYLIMATANGKIKRCSLAEFSAVRSNGLIAMGLDDGDELCWVKLTKGGDEIVMVTRRYKGLRFSEDDVRPMGRTAAGVMAIKLAAGDKVAAMDISSAGKEIFLITAQGMGKRTSIDDYPLQKRYGSGVIAMSLSRFKSSGEVTDARAVNEADEVTIMSENGQVMRTLVRNIPLQGRSTRGASIMNMNKGDTVASIARIPSSDEGGNPEGDGGAPRRRGRRREQPLDAAQSAAEVPVATQDKEEQKGAALAAPTASPARAPHKPRTRKPESAASSPSQQTASSASGSTAKPPARSGRAAKAGKTTVPPGKSTPAPQLSLFESEIEPPPSQGKSTPKSPASAAQKSKQPASPSGQKSAAKPDTKKPETKTKTGPATDRKDKKSTAGASKSTQRVADSDKPAKSQKPATPGASSQKPDGRKNKRPR
ncbi:MAG: DNA gyrase subunit A [Chloroflexi bacterium]|nr:DNA gyrase subunit A [Chloroflexota bacterium]